MPGQKETTPPCGRVASDSLLAGDDSDQPTKDITLGELISTRRLFFEPDRNGKTYQYRVRWRRTGMRRNFHARRYDRWYAVYAWVQKLTQNPTYGGARPLEYVAIDRREIVPGWETLGEWDDL